MNIVVRGIRSGDIEHFYGRQSPHTVIGSAIELDGRLVCIAGIVIRNKFIEAFSECVPDINVPKRTIWRYAKHLADYIASLGYPVIAKTENSGKFLRSLGFKQQGKDYIL